jgi:hypothetical protein
MLPPHWIYVTSILTHPRAKGKHTRASLTYGVGFDIIEPRYASKGGEDTTETEQSLIEELVVALAYLGFNAGLMDSVAGNFPPDAQENWRQKIVGMTAWAYQEMEEVQAFAEAYDTDT